MKHCDQHFEAIKAEIKRQGMWHLVSEDKRRVVEQTARWLTGRLVDKSDINPLAIVCCEVLQRAATVLPSYVQRPDRNYCPLCEAVKLKGAGTDREWVEGYALAVRRLASGLGLVAKPADAEHTTPTVFG